MLSVDCIPHIIPASAMLFDSVLIVTTGNIKSLVILCNEDCIGDGMLSRCQLLRCNEIITFEIADIIGAGRFAFLYIQRPPWVTSTPEVTSFPTSISAVIVWLLFLKSGAVPSTIRYIPLQQGTSKREPWSFLGIVFVKHCDIHHCIIVYQVLFVPKYFLKSSWQHELRTGRTCTENQDWGILHGKDIGDFVPGKESVELGGLSSVNPAPSITFSAVDTKSCIRHGAEPDLDRF